MLQQRGRLTEIFYKICTINQLGLFVTEMRRAAE
jgi:hypothetical protein